MSACAAAAACKSACWHAGSTAQLHPCLGGLSPTPQAPSSAAGLMTVPRGSPVRKDVLRMQDNNSMGSTLVLNLLAIEAGPPKHHSPLLRHSSCLQVSAQCARYYPGVADVASPSPVASHSPVASPLPMAPVPVAPSPPLLAASASDNGGGGSTSVGTIVGVIAGVLVALAGEEAG